jgi:hypothetical protein
MHDRLLLDQDEYMAFLKFWGRAKNDEEAEDRTPCRALLPGPAR